MKKLILTFILWTSHFKTNLVTEIYCDENKWSYQKNQQFELGMNPRWHY